MAAPTSSQKILQSVSIEDFIAGLRKLQEKDFTGIEGALEYMRANPVDPETLKPYLFWSAQHYTRNLIDKTDLYELLSLCWEPGMKSSIHNHKGQNCWMAAPVGRFLVQNYRVLEENLVGASLQHRSHGRSRHHVGESRRRRSAESRARRSQPARVERTRRQPAHLLAAVRLLRRLLGRAVLLRRDRPAVHLDVRKAV